MVQSLFSQRKGDQPQQTASANGGPSADSKKTVDIDLQSITISPENGMHKSTLIFLHNRAEVTEEYEIVFKRFMARDDSLNTVKVILPEGPQTDSSDGGDDLPCWCDNSFECLLSDRHEGKTAPTVLTSEDVKALQGIEDGCDRLAHLVESELNYVKANRIVIAGFHEGAVVAMFTALTKLEISLGGVICLGLPRLSKRVCVFLNNRSPLSSKNSRLFIMNGSNDNIATPAAAEANKQLFSAEGFTSVIAEAIPNGCHEIADEELAHVAAALGIIV
eukprot:GHVQ01003979.1.p1 GENE.GHVQ01003979.1~~GHVQ01003979.1.p1  ORF type:complete len:276 (-),score=40.05 GHVQ01003979.1:1346-2173(-)